MRALPPEEEKNRLPEGERNLSFSVQRKQISRQSAWRKHGESILRHTTLKLLQLIAILIVGGIPFLLLIVHIHGLGETITHKVEKALSGEFYDISIEKIFFSMGKGIVAKDLKILEHNETHRLLAHANKVAILPKLSALSRGKIEIESFQLHHAAIDVPLGNKEEPRLQLDHVEAKMIFPPGQLILSNASFNLCGIHIQAHGSFLNPKTFAPQPVASGGPGKIAQTIEMIQQGLKRIQWEGAPPLLEIEASGDLTHAETIHADHVAFRAGPCSYSGWSLNSLTADLEYANQVLKIQQFSLEDHMGEMHAWGSADFQQSQASLNFSGTCDIIAIASTLFPTMRTEDWKWENAPLLEGSGGANWANGTPLFHGEAHITASPFSYRGIAMDHLSGGCVFDQGRFLLRDFEAVGAPGSMHADLMLAPNDYRARISATILPQFLMPLATGGGQTTLSLLNFKDPFNLAFEGHSLQPDFLLWEGLGSLSLGHSSMRNAWIDSLLADFQLKEGVFTFQNILAKIGDKKAEGSCIYDIKNQEVRFPGIHSTLDPVPILMWIDPHIADSLKDYRFHVPPDLQVTGTIGLKDPQKNNFKIQLKAPQGLDYTLIKRDLTFNEVGGTVLIKKQELFVDLPRATLFGGSVALNATVSIAPGDPSYGASAVLDGVDFRSLTKLYFDYNESQGKLNGTYKFKTMTGNDYAMTGKGNLLIKDGNVLAMPILGPLSILMNNIYPGLGYQSARQASADFTVQKGVITTKNLSIQSAEFSMIGSGDIYYLEDRMNMQMRLNVKGLPGLVLFPVSKFFEYVSDGSAKHPVWRPKYLPGLPGK